MDMVGSMDGTHIVLEETPIWRPAAFSNYQKCYSMQTLAVVDQEGLFIYLRTGLPGQEHDSRVFADSQL
ncbi:hypothetical protein H4S01_000946, partial [Coemansia sp. RSA 2610]